MSRTVLCALAAGVFLLGSAALPASGRQVATPAPGPTPTAAARAGSPDVVAGIPVNYDEAKTGTYELPDPLRLANGQPVRDARTWTTRRRPEIRALFEENQHGKAPGRPADMVFDLVDAGTPAFDGKALRKQVRIHFRKDRSGPVLNLVSYTPATARGPSPLLLNISFSANAVVTGDPGVAPGLIWNATQHKRVAAPAGRLGRVEIAPFLDAGIGFATFYYGDVDPDDFNATADGVRQLYLAPGQKYRKPDQWGSMGAWAWGISRAIDYLATDKAVDARRIAVTGVSRLGKAVLWAGASDTRIAAVIASVSGEGGAAISRRHYGETIAHYVAPSRYPYHFAANYARFAAEPASAPMDGNLLVALIAPRPLLLQTGSTDHWSDPRGEFLSAVDASRVYELLGKTGLRTTTFPAPGNAVGGTLRYFMHDGGHGVLPADWPVYIAFLKEHLKP